MRAHRGRHGSRDNWCVLEYNTQTKEADRLINYDGAVRKISVPTVVLCYLQWKANPNGDGTGLENRRALIAPLEFDSLAFRQISPLPPMLFLCNTQVARKWNRHYNRTKLSK